MVSKVILAVTALNNMLFLFTPHDNVLCLFFCLVIDIAFSATTCFFYYSTDDVCLIVKYHGKSIIQTRSDEGKKLVSCG